MLYSLFLISKSPDLLKNMLYTKAFFYYAIRVVLMVLIIIITLFSRLRYGFILYIRFNLNAFNASINSLSSLGTPLVISIIKSILGYGLFLFLSFSVFINFLNILLNLTSWVKSLLYTFN